MQQPHYNKDLDVRQLGPEDLPHARLVAGRAFMEHAEDWYGEDETTLAGFDGKGTLVCALGYQPESLWWGAAQIPAGAIGAVATDPKHRRRGHAGGLIVQAIHILRERGCCISPLWPFSFRWYGKFGWACPAPRLELKVWPDLVRQATEIVGEVRRATADDAAVVQRLHTEGAQLRNGPSVRSEAFWQKEDIRRELWVLEGDGGDVECSALVIIGDMGRGQGKRITVRELHGASFATQLKFVRSLADMDGVAALRLELPPDSLLLHVFPERFDASVEHDLALRVLDVGQALAQLKPPSTLRATVSFEVADWVVNADKPLAATVQAEGGQVQVAAKADKDALCCDINTFTQLFAGGLTVAQARAMGRLTGGNPAVGTACDALLHGRVPYRSDVEMG